MKQSPKKVIIDASAMLSLIFPDEEISSYHQQIFDQFQNNTVKCIAPPLLKIEVANALKNGVKRKRLTPDIATQIFQKFLQLPIEYKSEDASAALSLAIRHDLSVYDAIYLAQVIQLKLELITRDKKLDQVKNVVLSIKK